MIWKQLVVANRGTMVASPYSRCPDRDSNLSHPEISSEDYNCRNLLDDLVGKVLGYCFDVCKWHGMFGQFFPVPSLIQTNNGDSSDGDGLKGALNRTLRLKYIPYPSSKSIQSLLKCINFNKFNSFWFMVICSWNAKDRGKFIYSFMYCRLLTVTSSQSIATSDDIMNK
jgi:hypothetical protein